MKIIIKRSILLITILLFNPSIVQSDEIILENGDRITGEVIHMEEEKLLLKTSYAGEISIIWAEVSQLRADGPIVVVLSDETSLSGSTKATEIGKMKLKIGKIVETVSFDLGDVKAINPKPKEEEEIVKLKGHVNIGVTSTSGNSNTESQHLDAEFVARTARNRYTIVAELNRAEDDDQKTVNNILGSGKYDHFFAEKWFFYANTSFEKDEFKDLNLRSVFGMGVGYQFFETPIKNLSFEAGLNYINEDFDGIEDDDYPAGRCAISYDHYLFKNLLQFFHSNEALIGMEDSDDILLKTRTGLRLRLRENLNTTFQYNYDWDKSPKAGNKKSDDMYLLTLGYNW